MQKQNSSRKEIQNYDFENGNLEELLTSQIEKKQKKSEIKWPNFNYYNLFKKHPDQLEWLSGYLFGPKEKQGLYT